VIDGLPFLNANMFHNRSALGRECRFHFHRFDHDQRLPRSTRSPSRTSTLSTFPGIGAVTSGAASPRARRRETASAGLKLERRRSDRNKYRFLSPARRKSDSAALQS